MRILTNKMYNSLLLHIILIYLAVINVVTFFMFGVDKWKAKRSKWRIPEATLLLMAVIGGSVGAWLGMKVWHHKTLHKKFRYGVPLILIVQIALLFFTSCKTKHQLETATWPCCKSPMPQPVSAHSQHLKGKSNSKSADTYEKFGFEAVDSSTTRTDYRYL